MSTYCAFQPPPFFTPPPTQYYATPGGVFSWTPTPSAYTTLPPWGQYSSPSQAQAILPAQYPTSPYSPPGWTPAPWVPARLPGTQPTIKTAPWLIPNPLNPQTPPTLWDITQVPTTAKRLTGNHVITDLTAQFDAEATSPAAPKVHIVCTIDIVNRLWGPIIVKNEGGVVKVWDILLAIYNHFQMPLTRREVDLITEADEKNYEKIVEAMWRRCSRAPSLTGREWKEGLKRADVLGDLISFGGLRVVENPDNTWQFHLDLLNRRDHL